MKQIIFVILFTLFSTSVFAGETLLWFKSTPGDPVGGGKEYFYKNSENSDIKYISYPHGLANFFVNARNYSDPLNQPYGRLWSVRFYPIRYQKLEVGTYQDLPGIGTFETEGFSFLGDGGSCLYSSNSSFTVLDIVYDANNRITTFAADFEQHCTSDENIGLIGEIRYNSDLPFTLYSPVIEIESPRNSDNCIEATNPEGGMVTVSGFWFNQDVVNASWNSTNGQSAKGSTFTLPVSLDEPVGVTLTVTNENGGSKETSRFLCVSDTTEPNIQILSPEPGDIFTGNNLSLDVRVSDAVDQQIDSYEVFVGKSMKVELKDGRDKIKLDSPSLTNGLTEITVKATDRYGNEGEGSVMVHKTHDNR